MPPTPSPTYERLRDTITKRMRVSHIYQPLKLMELLGRRSPAPAQDVARRILGEDVTQIDYYTERVKRMVGRVHLQRHHPLRAAKGRCECCGAGCCLANPDPVTHGDPAAAWVRWVGVASAEVECGGGADRQADAHESCGQTVHRRRDH